MGKEEEINIGRMINLGKKKGKITGFEEETEIDKGIKKLAHYKVEIENSWGVDEVDIPLVAVKKSVVNGQGK